MYQNIENAQFDLLMKKPDHIVLDVRTAKEVQDGFIAGAVFLDVSAPDFEVKIELLDKNKNYLVYCRSGARSAKACRIMEQKGFKGTIYNLAMGFANWNGNVKKSLAGSR